MTPIAWSPLLLNAEVARLAREDFRRRAAKLDLTQPQWQLLFHLSQSPGLTQVALAERLDVHPVTVTQALDRLGRAGWVRRERHAEDRRAFQVYLTDTAKPVITDLHRLSRRMNDVALAGLSAAERQQLTRFLQRIKENLMAARSEAVSAAEASSDE